MKKERLLYISSGSPTFVVKDVLMLSEKYEVKHWKANWFLSNWMIPFRMVWQFFQLIFTANKYKAIIVMFGGYWSLIPSMVGRWQRVKVIIIAGGTDCVSYPSINYGSLRKRVLRMLIFRSFKNAALICPVDHSLEKFHNDYYDGSYQGFRNHFPSLKTPSEVIYNGYNVVKFNHSMHRRKNNSFITVALANTMERFVLKGIDLIVRNAHYFPNATFIIAGVSQIEEHLGSIPHNVIVIGKINSVELQDLMLETVFALQPSISEGFPNAICESMSCGCIPIVSPVGAMPKIIGDSGLIIERRIDEVYKATIQKAISLHSYECIDLSKKAKEAVLHFSLEERKRRLEHVISQELIGKK